jgi:hypothetical protein
MDPVGSPLIMMTKIFDKLKGIKLPNDRILFLLEQLPTNEKVHVEQFLIHKLREIYTDEIRRDRLNITD